MPRKKKEKFYATEVDLCAAFIGTLPEGWTAFAETKGWDILLSRDADGLQIGIEAKLRLNVDVVNQAIEEYGYIGVDHAGPDCRAVLVPSGDGGGFDRIAAYIGFTIIRMSRAQFYPNLPKATERWIANNWHEWAPPKRHKLPEYIPDVRAGARSPVQLTQWKIGALRLQVLLERNGHLTRPDFRVAGIDHRRWLAPATGWLTNTEGRFVKGPRWPDFAAHPMVFKQIKADMEMVTKMQKDAITGMLL